MTEQAYKSFCGDLVRNFDKDWSKVGSKLDFGFKFLSHIPEHAWKGMVQNAVNEWEGWPRNWVRAVKLAYESWRRDNVSASFVRYNVDDDPRYPVSQMWEAFWILSKQGDQSFDNFVKRTGMPKTDRDRVLNKHRVSNLGIIDDFKIPEIGIRTNTKTPRPARLPYREPGED